MENNENLVTEQVTENMEQTTEQTPKTYTQDEVNDLMGKRTARLEAKLRKEYDRKYGRLEGVLKAGTGKQDMEEIADEFEQHYAEKGITMPQKQKFSDSDLATLAEKDATEIISAGYDEVVDEVDRLTKLGADHMTDREKLVFKTLAQHRQNVERETELAKLGVTEEIYKSAEFQNFAKKFTSDTPITDVYDIYRKTHAKEVKTMGSMKSTGGSDSGVKDYYSFEEASKFTKADFDRNPELYKKVQESMTKWK